MNGEQEQELVALCHASQDLAMATRDSVNKILAWMFNQRARQNGESPEPATNSAMLEIAARGVIQAFDLNYGKDPFELTIKRLREALQLQQ